MTKQGRMKKGELIILTEGDYSDFCIVGLFRVQKGFSLEELRETCQTVEKQMGVFEEKVAELHEASGWYELSVAERNALDNAEDYVWPVFSVTLIQTLIKLGWIEEVDTQEFNIDYGPD